MNKTTTFTATSKVSLTKEREDLYTMKDRQMWRLKWTEAATCADGLEDLTRSTDWQIIIPLITTRCFLRIQLILESHGRHLKEPKYVIKGKLKDKLNQKIVVLKNMWRWHRDRHGTARSPSKKCLHIYICIYSTDTQVCTLHTHPPTHTRMCTHTHKVCHPQWFNKDVKIILRDGDLGNHFPTEWI